MNLTQSAIENNRITAVALLIILIAGFSSYQNLPRNEDPGFIIRTALVMTYFPGASPERVEQLVTDKLEKTIQEILELFEKQLSLLDRKARKLSAKIDQLLR